MNHRSGEYFQKAYVVKHFYKISQNQQREHKHPKDKMDQRLCQA